MLKVLQTYIHQRFSATLFVVFSVWLFLYAVPFYEMNILSGLNVLKVFFILWSFRLYDDVMQWQNDEAFEDRIYTGKNSRSKLIFPLVVSLLFVPFITVDPPYFQLASGWLYFIIINHVLYKVFVHSAFGSFILPLLKYPLIYVYLIYSCTVVEDFAWEILLSALAVFFAMVLYDLLEDRERDSQVSIWIYFLIVFCVAGVTVQNLTLVSLIAGIVVLITSVVLAHVSRKGIAQLWLFLFLILKLIVSNYGI